MNDAILKAVYYSNYSNNNNNQNNKIKTVITYDGTEQDFISTIQEHLINNIEIRKLFGTNDNISYKILDSVSKLYKKLLVNNIDKLYIITREGDIINIKVDKLNKDMVGIIRIDAVLAELNINKYMNQTSTIYKVIKTISFLTVMGFGGWYVYNYQTNLNFFDFAKND